jgi:hypothetical protein
MMMGKTEERLRDATTSLGSTLQPEDIPPLRLPETPARRPRRRQVSARQAATRQTSRRLLVPLAAAASVVAVIGLVTLAHNAQAPRLGRDKVPAATGGPHGATGGPPAASPGLPRYLVTTVDGQAAVHATA